MVSLAQTIAGRGSVLVIDAASARVQAGLYRAGRDPVWCVAGDDAAVHVFAAVETVLRGAELRPGEVGAYVFCDGPGGQLGIRTVCMALRTWQTLRSRPAPVFAYRSLRLAAQAERTARGRTGNFAVVADARRDAWHAVRANGAGEFSDVLRVSTAELSGWSEELLHPEGFRAWGQPPRPFAECSYACRALWAAQFDAPLLVETAEPAPWQSAAVTYQTWSGERHRAPVAAQQAAAQQ